MGEHGPRGDFAARGPEIVTFLLPLATGSCDGDGISPAPRNGQRPRACSTQGDEEGQAGCEMGAAARATGLCSAIRFISFTVFCLLPSGQASLRLGRAVRVAVGISQHGWQQIPSTDGQWAGPGALFPTKKWKWEHASGAGNGRNILQSQPGKVKRIGTEYYYLIKW